MDDNKFTSVILEDSVLPLTGLRLKVSEQRQPCDARGKICVVSCEFVYNGRVGVAHQCFYPDELSAFGDNQMGDQSARTVKIMKLMVLRQAVDSIAAAEGFSLKDAPLNSTNQGNPIP